MYKNSGTNSLNCTVQKYDFESREKFINQGKHLTQIDNWYKSADKNMLAVYGRRRTGKTWLMKKFADKKPALYLIASKGNTRKEKDAIYSRFAKQLGEALPVIPEIKNLSQLFEAFFEAGLKTKTLIILDEFPYLLSSQEKKRFSELTEVQKVIDELRDKSNNKIIICGSYVDQMEKLSLVENPLYGRIRQHKIKPLNFKQVNKFSYPLLSDEEKIERSSISGGYINSVLSLFEQKPLRDIIIPEILTENGSLYNEPRIILQKEIKKADIPLEILKHLHRPKTLNQIKKKLDNNSYDPHHYLNKLIEIGIVESRAPVGAFSNSRKTQFFIDDGFFRFWFRFVLPKQKQIERGLELYEYYEDLENDLSDFVGFYFELLCQEYCLKKHSNLCSDEIGAWWGQSLHKFRRKEQNDPDKRMNEEIDIAGRKNKTLTLVGECKWTKNPLSSSILEDIFKYKLPAIKEESKAINSRSNKPENIFDSKKEHKPHIILFSKSGFTKDLLSKNGKEIEGSSIELVPLCKLIKELNQ